MTDREREITRLVLSAVDECAVCGREYQTENIAIIGNRGDLWVLMLRCPACRKQGFIAALINGEGPPRALLPPADMNEALAIAGDPVTARDVLDMHEFLDRFRGNLGEYLSDR